MSQKCTDCVNLTCLYSFEAGGVVVCVVRWTRQGRSNGTVLGTTVQLGSSVRWEDRGCKHNEGERKRKRDTCNGGTVLDKTFLTGPVKVGTVVDGSLC